MAQTRALKSGTNQWLEIGTDLDSKLARTRPEKGMDQARKRHEPGSKAVRKNLRFVSLRLEARQAKWPEQKHDRRIDVTQMTGNSVRKAIIVVVIVTAIVFVIIIVKCDILTAFSTSSGCKTPKRLRGICCYVTDLYKQCCIKFKLINKYTFWMKKRNG